MPYRRRPRLRGRKPRRRGGRLRYLGRKRYSGKVSWTNSMGSRWLGQLRMKRTSNVCNGSAVGFTVGGTLSISTNNLVVTTSGTPAAVQYGNFSFYACLSDMPSYSEFSALYDRYKIVGFKIRIVPYNTSSATGAAFASGVGQYGMLIHWVNDYDDNALPTASDAGIDSLRQYPSYRWTNLVQASGRGVSRYVKPRIAKAVYGGGAFTSYANDKFGWIDMVSTTVPGYGVKGIIETVSSGVVQNILLKVEVIYYVVLRDPR